MHGESRYSHRPAGYRYADDDEQWYRDRRAAAGLLLAVITVHLAGPWTAVPGPGR